MRASETAPGSSRWSECRPGASSHRPRRTSATSSWSSAPAVRSSSPSVTRRRLYTGDPIDPLVGLHYGNGTTPHGAQVELTVEVPGIALGQLATEAGLQPPMISADAVDAFHATLQAIARRAGGVLPVPTSTVRVPLFDDGLHDDGAMEPDGIYNHRLKDLTRAEGTYQFRAVATYGEGCRAMREALWSLHVEPGIDPDRSGVTLVDVVDQPDGRRGTLVIDAARLLRQPARPRPGRRVHRLAAAGCQGRRQGQGSGRRQLWGRCRVGLPRNARARRAGTPARPGSRADDAADCRSAGRRWGCNEAAGKLLDCLGLQDPDVKCVRVKSVCIEVDLKDPKCGKNPDC